MKESYLEESKKFIFTHSKKALAADDFVAQQAAFDEFGVEAIENGKWQLAYDIYYSWFNRRLVGELEGNKLPHFEQGTGENFQGVNEKQEAIMHNNFAYVCSVVSESYEFGSPKGEVLHEKAVKNIEMAIEKDPNEPVFHSTYGEILCGDVKRREVKEEKESREESAIQALNQFRIYERMTNAKSRDYPEYSVDSLREVSKMLARLLTWRYWEGKEQNFHELLKENEDYNELFKEFTKKFNQYRQQSNRYYGKHKMVESEEKKEWEKCRCIFEVMQYTSEHKNSVELKEIQVLLCMIDETAMALKQQLQWREYCADEFKIYDEELDQPKSESDKKQSRMIAYYTTLKTATHVFDKLVQKEFGKAPVLKENCDNEAAEKNCLTVMHAKYMNDPHEGLALLNVFSDEINQQVEENIEKEMYDNTKETVLKNVIWHDTTDRFREEIFDNNFVFLKSFTQQADNLIMWNRYASDFLDGGRDSNGCFIELDGRCFKNVIYDKAPDQSKTKKKDNLPEDNFHLYHVVYISPEGKIKAEKNPELSGLVEKYYSLLKKMLRELNKYLCRPEVRNPLDDKWGHYVSAVRRCLQQSLRFIIFLFKEDDYADEKESRMVFTQKSDQMDLIRVLDGTPEKLCVNPFFQIYIKKITLGPNVRNPEVWKPYFQYHLSKMWESYPYEKGGKSPQTSCPYEIGISKIHYRTHGNGK